MSISEEVGRIGVREAASSACSGGFPVLKSGSLHATFVGENRKTKNSSAEFSDNTVKAGHCRGEQFILAPPASDRIMVRFIESHD